MGKGLGAFLKFVGVEQKRIKTLLQQQQTLMAQT
jgi:hypothetical protein